MNVHYLTVASEVLIRHDRNRVQNADRRRLRKHNAESQPGDLIPSASLVYAHIGAPHGVPHVAVLERKRAHEARAQVKDTVLVPGTRYTLAIFSEDADEELRSYRALMHII